MVLEERLVFFNVLMVSPWVSRVGGWSGHRAAALQRALEVNTPLSLALSLGANSGACGAGNVTCEDVCGRCPHRGVASALEHGLELSNELARREHERGTVERGCTDGDRLLLRPCRLEDESSGSPAADDRKPAHGGSSSRRQLACVRKNLVEERYCPGSERAPLGRRDRNVDRAEVARDTRADLVVGEALIGRRDGSLGWRCGTLRTVNWTLGCSEADEQGG
jgi:hypothetical protein